MTLLQALILGAVQGLTEFLPISSSGHLTLGQALLGLEEPDVFFDVIVHVGTLLAVLTYYRRDILALIAGLFAPRIPGTGWLAAENWSGRPGRWMVVLIGLGTIPTGLIGIFFKDFFEAAFHSLAMVGGMLLVTAALLVGTYFSRVRADGPLRWYKALIIGLVQGLAILPGISRSGSTIATAFYLRVKPEQAARFSFLLSVPAILGALVLKLGDIAFDSVDVAVMAVGFVSSMLVGYIALWLVIKLVSRGQLHWFAIWCAFMALLAFLKAG